LYLYKSRIPEAVAEFQKELTINPATLRLITSSATPNSRLQNWDEAERLLQRSIWLDATSTGPYILMGKVLLRKGEVELAVRALRRAEAMDPPTPCPISFCQATGNSAKRKMRSAKLRMASQANSAQDLKEQRLAGDPAENK